MIIVQKKNKVQKQHRHPTYAFPIWEDLAYFPSEELFTEEEKNKLHLTANEVVRILTVTKSEEFKIKTAVCFEKVEPIIKKAGTPIIDGEDDDWIV